MVFDDEVLAAVAHTASELVHELDERHEALAGCLKKLPPRDRELVLTRVDGEPVATGERFTFDGASYLSSIGTRPAWRGRGFARLITTALARDSVAGGSELVYLGVYADNTRAIRLYDRLGFRMLGPRSSDMLLERPR